MPPEPPILRRTSRSHIPLAHAFVSLIRRYDLQRNYNAAQISLHSQQRMIADLKESLRAASTLLLKTDPHYACAKFDLQQLVACDKIIPQGMDGAEIQASQLEGFKKLPLKMSPRYERGNTASGSGSAAHSRTASAQVSDDESGSHSGSESAEEVEAKDDGAGALLALAAMAGRR